MPNFFKKFISGIKRIVSSCFKTRDNEKFIVSIVSKSEPVVMTDLEPFNAFDFIPPIVDYRLINQNQSKPDKSGSLFFTPVKIPKTAGIKVNKWCSLLQYLGISKKDDRQEL